MKIGLFYVLECHDGQYEKAYNEMLEQIQYGEELGFESVWLAEHHFNNYGSIPSPQVAAAAIAQVTKKMDIGIAVSILNFANPMRIAEDYAMVDNLSNGRLIFGGGRAYQPKEYERLGIPMENTREVFWESVDVIRGLWENETFSYNGKYFQFEDVSLAPKPVQKRIPFYLAAISPETFDIAVEKNMYEFMVTPTLMVLDELKEFIVKTRKRFIDKGIQPKVHMNWQMNIADTHEQAVKNVEKEMKLYFDTILDIIPGAHGTKVPATYERFGEVAKSFTGSVDVRGLNETGITILEDPKTALKQIEGVADIGVNSLSCWFRMGGMEHRKVMKTMKMFADEILPYFKSGVRDKVTQ